MRFGSVVTVVVGAALLVTGCGREEGTDEIGPVDQVTQATVVAADQITAILNGPVPSDSAGAASSEPSGSDSPESAVAPSGTATESTSKIIAPAEKTRDTLTVWLMPEVPGAVVDRVNKLFRKDYPKVDVNVERQDWATISQLLQERLPDPETTPDIVEIANDTPASLGAEGLIADLDSVRTKLRLAEWTKGLRESVELGDELVGVPLYGQGRVVAYDKAAWKAAGVAEPPRTMSEMEASLDKVQSGGVQPDYSAFWFPGRYWQGALPWIWSDGGELAVPDGDSWVGAVDSSESQAGLLKWQTLVLKFSRAPADSDETSASQVKALDDGRAASALMLPWEVDALTKAHGVFALPGETEGAVAPQLLEGSDLAVSSASIRQGLAVEWLARFLDDSVQRQLARDTKTIPALASAVSELKGDPVAEIQAKLAPVGRTTPPAALWPAVEREQVLPDMLQAIMTKPGASESPSASVSGGSPSGPVSPSPSAPSTGLSGFPSPSGVPTASATLPSGPPSLSPSEMATGSLPTDLP